jgi:hypothetical protein
VKGHRAWLKRQCGFLIWIKYCSKYCFF